MASPNIASRRVGMASEVAILFFTITVGTSVSCFSLFFTNTKGYKRSVGVALIQDKNKFISTKKWNPIKKVG
jgi:hypothetical protein